MAEVGSGQAGGGVTSTNLKAGEGTGSATVVSGAAQRFFKSLLRKRKRLASWAMGTAWLNAIACSHKGEGMRSKRVRRF